MPTPRKKPATAKTAVTKPTTKAALTKPVAKPAAVPPAAPVQAARKDAKEKKPKLVRDSFTIPKTEYAVLESLKQRAAQAGAPSKKSEVLRAGIKALAGLSDAAFLAAMKAVPSLKTGRPAKQ